jgi:sulfite reductase alpha subunit-like flavoprotein
LNAEEKSGLSHQKFLMSDLGDKTYQNFYGYGKSVKAEMETRKAVCGKELEICSDHKNHIETHFVEWKKNIWEEVKGHLIEKEGAVEKVVGRVRLNSYDNKNPFGLKYEVQFVTETPLLSRDWHNADASEMDLCA